MSNRVGRIKHLKSEKEREKVMLTYRKRKEYEDFEEDRKKKNKGLMEARLEAKRKNKPYDTKPPVRILRKFKSRKK